MISTEKYDYIRKLEIKTKILADSILSGLYRSAFKGSGQDFSDSRLYEDGDDLRRIDSRLSARDNQLYIRQYEEERQINVIIAVDVSNSIAGGENESGKLTYLSDIAATLASIAFYNNDQVGLVLFDSEIVKSIPPRHRQETLLELISAFFEQKQSTGKTDIKAAINYINSIFRQKSVVFFISDFLDDNFSEELRVADEKYDLILIHLIDNLLTNQLPKGIYSIIDSETGKTKIIEIKNSETDIEQNSISNMKEIASDNAVDLIQITPQDSFLNKFEIFMRHRFNY